MKEILNYLVNVFFKLKHILNLLAEEVNSSLTQYYVSIRNICIQITSKHVRIHLIKFFTSNNP